jgi:hypothetical protein
MGFLTRFCLSVLLVLTLAAIICGVFYVVTQYTLISVCVLVVGGLALLITLSSYEEEEIRKSYPDSEDE